MRSALLLVRNELSDTSFEISLNKKQYAFSNQASVEEFLFKQRAEIDYIYVTDAFNDPDYNFVWKLTGVVIVDLLSFYQMIKNEKININLKNFQLEMAGISKLDLFQRKINDLKSNRRFPKALIRYEELEFKLMKGLRERKGNVVKFYKNISLVDEFSIDFGLEEKKLENKQGILKSIHNGLRFEQDPYWNFYATKTGRIILGRPCLQYLRKHTRSNMFRGDLYEIDYECFEPTILSALSKDVNMHQHLNDNSFYDHLAFLLKMDRRVCKGFFIRLLYGMGNERLQEFLVENNYEHLFSEILVKIIKEKFNQAFEWIEKFSNISLSCGEINHSLILSYTLTENYPKNKIYNYLLQSVGSNIFKTALLESIEKYPINVLLPLHDGFIFEAQSEDVALDVKNIFEKVFKKQLNYVCNVSLKNLNNA
jgi:hypothetical protein